MCFARAEKNNFFQDVHNMHFFSLEGSMYVEKVFNASSEVNTFFQRNVKIKMKKNYKTNI